MTNFENLTIIFNRVQGGKIAKKICIRKKNSMFTMTKAGTCNSSFADEGNRAYKHVGDWNISEGYVALGEWLVSAGNHARFKPSKIPTLCKNVFSPVLLFLLIMFFPLWVYILQDKCLIYHWAWWCDKNKKGCYVISEHILKPIVILKKKKISFQQYKLHIDTQYYHMQEKYFLNREWRKDIKYINCFITHIWISTVKKGNNLHRHCYGKLNQYVTNLNI